jgi:hypothetical protein
MFPHGTSGTNSRIGCQSPRRAARERGPIHFSFIPTRLELINGEALQKWAPRVSGGQKVIVVARQSVGLLEPRYRRVPRFGQKGNIERQG